MKKTLESSFYLNKKKLMSYIKSRLVNTYNAIYKCSFGKHLRLAYYGLELDNNGDFIKGNGRINHYDEYGKETKGIVFLTKPGIMVGLRFLNSKEYNFKQKRTMWLLKKIFELG